MFILFHSFIQLFILCRSLFYSSIYLFTNYTLKLFRLKFGLNIFYPWQNMKKDWLEQKKLCLALFIIHTCTYYWFTVLDVVHPVSLIHCHSFIHCYSFALIHSLIVFFSLSLIRLSTHLFTSSSTITHPLTYSLFNHSHSFTHSLPYLLAHYCHTIIAT